MRFILNFFFFGILFYLIYLFFPEAFVTLVSWADKTYHFLHDLFLQIFDRLRGHRTEQPPAQPGLLIPFFYLAHQLRSYAYFKK